METNRALPHCLDYEQIILNGLIYHDRNDEIISFVLNQLTASDFFSRGNSEIFAAVNQLYQEGSPIDPVTVRNRLTETSPDRPAIDNPLIVLVTDIKEDIFVRWEDLPYFIKQVKEKAHLRRLIKALGRGIEACHNANGDYSEKISSIERDLSNALIPISESATENRYNQSSDLTITSPKDILSLPQSSFLIEPILVENSLTILGAATGNFKSVLSLVIAKAVATGESFCKHFNIHKKGTVLVIDAENPGAVLRDRFTKIGITEEMPIKYLHYQSVKLDDEKSFEKLLRKIDGIKPTLIIFDSLIRFHSKDENPAGEMSLVMEKLRHIVVRFKTTCLVLHHCKKNSFGSNKESLRGSSDIPGAADSVIIIKRTGNRFILSCAKSRIAPFESISLKLNFGDTIFITYDGKAIDEDVLESIIEIIGDGKLTFEEINDSLKKQDIKIGEMKLRNILRNAVNNKRLLIEKGSHNITFYKISFSV